MFSSLSNFKVSSSHQFPFFTNPSIELFPSDSDAGTSHEVYNASPHAPTSFVEDDLPTGNALDNFEPFSTSSSVSPVDVTSDNVESANELVVPSLSHPTQVRNSPSDLHDYHCFPGITSLHEPQSYQETSFNPLWQQAMEDELQALENTRTWDLVDLLTEKSLIGYIWVYKIKLQSDGSVERYKARLAQPSFKQGMSIAMCIIWVEAIPLSLGMILLLLCVDDMIITGDDVASVEELKQSLSQKFEMKDLGGLSYFLGLEVTSSDDGYLLSQVKYASDLISKAELDDSKSSGLSYHDTPDIAYAVHMVSQFMAAPHSTHYAVILRIIHYVKGTLFHGVHFSANCSPVLCVDFDADWVDDPSDCRSTTNYCLFLVEKHYIKGADQSCFELNHFSHPHPLLLVEDKRDQVREAYCSGCRELIQDSSYRCANCKFFLHKTCAELPRELDHPFHPQHPLVLYDKPQYDSAGVLFKCNSCRKQKGEGFVYHCSACEFDLDIQCALLRKLITGNFPKLQHFSHQYSLLFIEKHYIEDADQSCFACEDPISDRVNISPLQMRYATIRPLFSRVHDGGGAQNSDHLIQALKVWGRTIRPQSPVRYQPPQTLSYSSAPSTLEPLQTPSCSSSQLST
ncbi:hypothetical protein SLEP1_g25984 [Rubroshorea leprosula]|uniref:Phorbol-ester/DAG-type domain-containing protein n=1 Tax=Rubroshorea leprosula TaxID=152421 RepID=A0AAV5JUD7_9ROSI|nr:hypothetical protein SLEP1_g25984 [Rubroshorea leprosula]